MTRIECAIGKSCAELAQAQQEIVVTAVETAVAFFVFIAIVLAWERWGFRP